jgi:hypothetical protein
MTIRPLFQSPSFFPAFRLSSWAFGLALSACALAPIASSPSAHAGGSGGVGSGGGAWTCRERDGSLRWVRLLDLDEGRREFVGFAHLPMGDEPEVADWTAEQWLERAERRLLEANIGFYSKYTFWKKHVLKQVQPISHSKFSSTDDFMARTAPDPKEFCPGGVIPAKPEQLANFNETIGMLEINEQLSKSGKLLPIDLAALYMHETIYFMFRRYAEHTDSAKARQLVAYLFSDWDVASFAQLLNTTQLKPAGEWSPQPGTYDAVRSTGPEFYGAVVHAFDPSTGVLELTQRNTRTGANKQRNTFLCQKTFMGGTKDRHEFACKMIYSSNRWTRWTRMDNHELRITDSGTFLWLNTRRGGVTWVTTYSKISDDKHR